MDLNKILDFDLELMKAKYSPIWGVLP